MLENYFVTFRMNKINLHTYMYKTFFKCIILMINVFIYSVRIYMQRDMSSSEKINNDVTISQESILSVDD